MIIEQNEKMEEERSKTEKMQKWQIQDLKKLKRKEQLISGRMRL